MLCKIHNKKYKFAGETLHFTIFGWVGIYLHHKVNINNECEPFIFNLFFYFKLTHEHNIAFLDILSQFILHSVWSLCFSGCCNFGTSFYMFMCETLFFPFNATGSLKFRKMNSRKWPDWRSSLKQQKKISTVFLYFVFYGPCLKDFYHPWCNFAIEKILSETTQKNLHTLECEEGKLGTQLETQIFDCKTKDHWREGEGMKERHWKTWRGM